MVSKYFLRRFPEMWDLIERNRKSELAKSEDMLEFLTKEKPRFWYRAVRKAESAIRQAKADLKRLEFVREEARQKGL